MWKCGIIKYGQDYQNFNNVNILVYAFLPFLPFVGVQPVDERVVPQCERWMLEKIFAEMDAVKILTKSEIFVKELRV